MALFKRKFNKRNDTFYIPAVFKGSETFSITSQDGTSFSAIDRIASAFANLGGHVYGKIDKEIDYNHRLYELLENPNTDETKFIFMYNSVRDYFNGNVFWYLSRLEDDSIAALYRLEPSKVTVTRDSFNRKIFKHDGKEYDSHTILHIPSRYGYDGLVGKSIFSVCQKVFKNSHDLESYLNNSFNHSVGNRLIIDITREYPDATEEQINQLKNKFMQNYTGIENAGRPLVKSGKIDYSKIETDYKDNRANQLLENRQFQEQDVSKLFGIPLALLKADGSSQNIENLFILFLETAIRPIATQFEQSINKLLPMNERSLYYFEYSFNSLLKTDLATRVSVYSSQLAAGILSPNEIRRKENLADIEAGDTHFIPASYLPLKDDIINSYMSKAKLNQIEVDNLSASSPNKKGEHLVQGDDKN